MPELPLEELLLSAMRSVSGSGPCCYLAGPLTSGRRMLQGNLSAGALEEANREEMRTIAAGLRRRLDYPVIDSGVLTVPSWSAREHGDFFLLVMERLATEVRFMQGWEYSSGATKEYLRALELSLPTLDLKGMPITPVRALDEWRAAQRVLRPDHPNLASKLGQRVARLRELLVGAS